MLGGAVVGAGGLMLGPMLSGCSSGTSHSGPSTSSTSGAGTPRAPLALTVSGLDPAIGLATDDVFFAWHINDPGRGATQEGYRIVVTEPTLPGNPQPAATIWDSGRVRSSQQAFIPYGGPPLRSATAYQWSVQTWSRAGVASAFSSPSAFETGLADGDWKAMWIREPSASVTDPDQYAYFRKEVDLDRAGTVRARAYVSAGQQYELWINGVRAAKGQAYSYPDSQYYETTDITRLLRPGARNAVGLLTNWQGATKGRPANAPGVIAQIEILHRDGRREMVVSDRSWKARTGAWLLGAERDLEGDQVDFTEAVDGRRVPVGWDRPGLDDNRWEAAEVVGPAGTEPWTHLVPVRTRVVTDRIRPVSVTALASGAMVADFGKVYAAVPSPTLHRGQAGRVVNMRAGYLLDLPVTGIPAGGEPGQVSTTHGTQHTDMAYRYIERGDPTESVHFFDYLGFRYFQVDSVGMTLTKDDLTVEARHAAVPRGQVAEFTSSNPTVDAVFDLGRHSALYCAQEQFIDTPTREKGSWLWDGFNASQTLMAAYGDQNLTRKSLVEFGESQARYWPSGAINKIYPTGLGALDIDEFALIYAEWVWQYWRNTGDRALLARLYPVLVKLAAYARRAIDPATGLVTNLPATGNPPPLPVWTRDNVLAANVFNRVADAADALGRRSESTSHRRAAARLQRAINERLTRPDGVYVDGLDASGRRSPTASQDTNACAVVYGIVAADRLGPVAAHIAGLGMAATPRTACEVLDALGRAGRVADIVRLVTDPKGDGWARILALGGTFTWEVWEPSDVIGDSMSHGWSSNVLVEIQRWLLGVRVTGPGYATFIVDPPAQGLDHAAGTVPTAQGPIEVAWTRGAALHLDLTVPPNAVATVALPSSSTDGSGLTEGGRPLASVRGVRLMSVVDHRAQLEVGSGSYHFVAK